MKYCINCGQKLADDAKFCANCGKAVGAPKNETTEQRKTVYEGEIHKCPHCGEILHAFVPVCPSCGHELRDTKSASSIREFSAKLEQIESSRSKTKFKWNPNRIEKADEQKITLIRSFPIPNAKEDLFEFIVLAASNIVIERYDNPDAVSESRKSVSDAWAAKLEQAYEKAKLNFGDTLEFNKVQEIYSQKHREIGVSQKKASRKKVHIYCGLALLALAEIILVVFVFMNDSRKIAHENERLNTIVQEVYDYIENEQYPLARAKAATLVFAGSSTQAGNQATEKWDKTRSELLRIIDEAESVKKDS